MKNINERILLHKGFDSTVLRLYSRRSHLESNFEVSNGSIEKLVEKIQAKPKLPSFHVCMSFLYFLPQKPFDRVWANNLTTIAWLLFSLFFNSLLARVDCFSIPVFLVFRVLRWRAFHNSRIKGCFPNKPWNVICILCTTKLAPPWNCRI